MFRSFNLDTAGFFTSLLCALHCSIMPVVVSLGIIHSSHWLHNGLFDMCIILIGILVAIAAFTKEYRKHKSYLPFTIAAIGFFILIFSMMNHDDPNHFMWSIFGGMTLAIAHVLNWKMRKTLQLGQE